MQRGFFVLLWGLGVVLLISLFRYPIQQSADSWDSWSLPLAGKKIVLDPGHGGVDGGAVGEDETLEKDIALEVSEKIQDYLQQAGAIVYLTRETDKDLAGEDTRGLSQRKVEDIKNRVAFTQEKDPDLFITIHLNALPSSQWSGAQTFYHPTLTESKSLAEHIQAEIKLNLANTNREALAINGVYVLKHANRPAALVEIGFLSNPEERELLKTEDYQEQMAACIYQGILNYLTKPSE